MMEEKRLRELLEESDAEHTAERIAIQLNALRREKTPPFFIDWDAGRIKGKRKVTER